MEYRTLGSTGLRLSEIGMGTSQTFRVAARNDEGQCFRVVHEALDRGINFFDTSPSYWESERVLGKALAGRRGEALIATKVRAENETAARASIERSFKHLRTDVIDLLQIHSMLGWREVTPVIQEYQRQGRVRFIGLTEDKPENFGEMLKAMRTGDYDSIQILYSVADRRCREEVLPLVRQMNIGVLVVRSILNLLADKVARASPAHPAAPLTPEGERARENFRHAREQGEFTALERFGIQTPGQALLKYVLNHPAVSSVLVATAKVERIAENVAASDGRRLDPEVCAWLENLVSK